MSTKPRGHRSTYSEVQVGDFFLRNGRYVKVVKVEVREHNVLVQYEASYNKLGFSYGDKEAPAYIL